MSFSTTYVNFTTNFLSYQIPVLQKMQIYLKVSRVIGSSDYSIFILRYVYFNVAIAILRLSQAFTEYIINCSELEGSQWSVFRQLTFLFLLSHRSLHAQNLPESLHCWFTRMSSIFIESTNGSATDKYLS